MALQTRPRLAPVGAVKRRGQRGRDDFIHCPSIKEAEQSAVSPGDQTLRNSADLRGGVLDPAAGNRTGLCL